MHLDLYLDSTAPECAATTRWPLPWVDWKVVLATEDLTDAFEVDASDAHSARVSGRQGAERPYGSKGEYEAGARAAGCGGQAFA